MTFAYCFASCEIGFSDVMPPGSLPIAKGPDKTLRAFISGIARHTYDGETLLVPGIPEATDETEALKAFVRFHEWIRGMRLPPTIETVRRMRKRSRQGR